MKYLIALFALALVGCGGGPRSCAAATPAAAPAPRPAVADAPHRMGVVGHVVLVNDSRQALSARTMSFGQVFPAGYVRVGDVLQLQVAGQTLPTQTDYKALHQDGSVRHAVMSVELPQVGGGKRLAADIVNTPPTPAPPAILPTATAPAVSVVVTLKPPGGAARSVQVDLPTVMQNPAAVSPDIWLSGPLSLERRYAADVTDQLQIVFDVFTPRSGPSRVDIAFHNDWTSVPRDGVIVYDVDIRLNGASVYKAADVEHYPYSNWRRLLWTDNQPSLRIVPDLATLQAAAAVPQYDPKFRVDGDLLRDLADEVRELGDEPLSHAMITRYMPSSGGRMDIGPLPTWAAVDLLAGDATTRRALLANADAAGAAPWHIREKATGKALTIDKYPNLWLDSRGKDPAPLPQSFHEESYGWTLDDAHQPSLTYLPYLITGLQYYRDELTQQAAYVLLSYDAGYRGGASGLIIGENGQAWQQVRGMAWSLRTIATAAYILPADDPMQGYFDRKLRGNLKKLTQLYVEERRLKDAGELEGWVPGAYRPEGWVAPWQQGFLAIVLGWINDMGYPDAGRTLGWSSNFLTGLFVSGDKGFDPYYGPAYTLAAVDPDTGDTIDTWSRAFVATRFTRLDRKESDDMWDFYGMPMRAALASAYGVNRSAQTERAYRYVTGELGGDATSGDPTFAIVSPALSGSQSASTAAAAN